MTINLGLSTESILAAISKLRNAKDNLEWGVAELLDSLSTNGAEVANDHYGSMAHADGYATDFTVGKIIVSGEVPGIAEFGAGDATIPVVFENEPDFPVYPGSWSEREGSGEYAKTGRWHFGGKEYTEVQPRMGLYNAVLFIEENSTDYAKELIRLD